MDFFRQAVELQKQFARDGQTIANALQTNGTLLDDAWCEFLAEHKFLVGLSLDGPPRVARPLPPRPARASHRSTARGRGWNCCASTASSSTSWSRSTPPTPRTRGDIYRYFVNRGIQYLQFIPILERDADGAADGLLLHRASSSGGSCWRCSSCGPRGTSAWSPSG